MGTGRDKYILMVLSYQNITLGVPQGYTRELLPTLFINNIAATLNIRSGGTIASSLQDLMRVDVIYLIYVSQHELENIYRIPLYNHYSAYLQV